MILHFFYGDTVLNTLQTTLYVDQDITIEANSPANQNLSWGSIGMIVGGVVVGVVGGCLAWTGVGAVASASGFAAAVTAIGTAGGSILLGAAGVVAGGYLAVNGVENTIENLCGDYELPYIAYTPFSIFSNQVPIFDINFFSPTDYSSTNTDKVEDVEIKSNIISESSASILQETISSWYYVLRNTAIVAMLSILVYMGIRMIISSASKDKAKYKQMFIDWLVGMCLILTMHYIMICIVNLSQKINGFIYPMCQENIIAYLPPNTTIKIPQKIDESGNIIQEAKEITLENNEQANVPIWNTNLIGYARLIAGGFANGDEAERGQVITKIEYTIIYTVMVIYTIIFTVIYLKRVLYMAFLTIISPLVAMTYPLDKIHDGQAQGFNTWIKEYIFNALLQPFHLLIYTILIGSVMNLASKYPIYAIVALGFIIPAEKMLKNMFGFNKAQSPASIGAMGAAGAGMIMSGMSKLLHGGPKKTEKEEKGKNDNIRFKPERNNDAIDTYASENSSNSLPEATEESPVRGMIDRDNEDFNNPEFDPHETAYLENDFSENMPTYNGTEEERLQELEDIYRTQGYDEEEINQMLGNTPDSNSIVAQENENNNILSNQIENNKPKLKNRIGRGILAIGERSAHRFKSSKPLRKVRRGITYALGAGTLGMIGLAAGIASGDLSKTGQYAATGAHVGGSVGRKLGDSIAAKGNTDIETFKQGYYGTDYEDKLREKQIKEWQADPENIQYLRARDENYRQTLRDVYPEYARQGCYNIEDFWAAYQLEKSGLSRATALSTYKLAKRTGDITTSPDAENKWQTRLEHEFANSEDIARANEVDQRRVEEQYRAQQDQIDAEFESEYRRMQTQDSNEEEELRRIEEEYKSERARLKLEYTSNYENIENEMIDYDAQQKQLELDYKLNPSEFTGNKYNEKFKELAKKKKARERKLKLLEQEYKEHQDELSNEYQNKHKEIEDKQATAYRQLAISKKAKLAALEKQREKQIEQIKENTSGALSKKAIENIKQFYDNKN